MPITYDGHPLELSCPHCLTNGTAWFSPDEAARLRIDAIPAGFRLVEPLEDGATGPLFSCVQCETMATNL